MFLGRVGSFCFGLGYFLPHLGECMFLGELPYIWKLGKELAARRVSSIPK